LQGQDFDNLGLGTDRAGKNDWPLIAADLFEKCQGAAKTLWSGV
tara:strand:- start:27 stop:158 length:132 start_codon:yes stop_codon:yes gene_type:complete